MWGGWRRGARFRRRFRFRFRRFRFRSRGVGRGRPVFSPREDLPSSATKEIAF